MPKATRKKVEKAADFKKAKLKLGKGKKAASNATDTSFKARSIALPSQKQLSRALQTEAEDEAGPSTNAIPTTASGLTIDDVLVQLRHVNAFVRKESLGHLKDVLIAGVNHGVPLGERHGEVAKVMRGIGSLISDDDATVRKTLHEFLSWYLARLPPAALSPYLPLIQLQISSALSHIFPAIRIDACKLVELLLETHAADVISKWPAKSQVEATAASAVMPTSGSTIFDGLRLSAGLGEEKGASTQGGFRMTNASKLVILRTIKTFVAKALESTAVSPIAPPRKAVPVLGEWTMTELKALPADQWSLLTTNDWGIVQEAKDMTRQDIATGDGALEELSSTYLALHALLLSTFMEAAPSAFPPSAASTSASVDEVSLSLCSVCMELVWVFARTFLDTETFATLSTASELRNCFSEFIKRATGWFPFNRTSQAASDAADTLFGLSLNYAKLAAALAPTPPAITLPKRKEGWRYRVRAIDAAWAGMKPPPAKGTNNKAATNEVAFRLASEWIEDCLTPSTDILAPQISATAYADLLPVIYTLACRPGSILEAFLPAVLRQASNSGKRRASDAFLISLVWKHEDRYSTLPFFIPADSSARAGINTWIGGIPRTLWELGAKDAEASEALLRFLLDLGTRAASFEKPFSLIDTDAFAGIAGKLGPFFHLTHPSKGAIEGPWAKLPVKTQRLALDVARVWAPFEPRLAAAVGVAVRGTWAQAYWARN